MFKLLRLGLYQYANNSEEEEKIWSHPVLSSEIHLIRYHLCGGHGSHWCEWILRWYSQHAKEFSLHFIWSLPSWPVRNIKKQAGCRTHIAQVFMKTEIRNICQRSWVEFYVHFRKLFIPYLKFKNFWSWVIKLNAKLTTWKDSLGLRKVEARGRREETRWGPRKGGWGRKREEEGEAGKRIYNLKLPTISTGFMLGLGQWLWSEEHTVVLLRTQAHFRHSMWVTAMYNPRSRASSALFWPPRAPDMHPYWLNIYTCKSN